MYSLTKGVGRVFETGVDGFDGIAIGTAPSQCAAGIASSRGMRSGISPLWLDNSQSSCGSRQNRTEQGRD